MKRVGILSVLLGLAIASCGDGEADPAVFDEVGGSEGVRRLGEIFRTQVSPEDDIFLLNVVDTLIERCMHEAGYHWFNYEGVTTEQVSGFGASWSDIDRWLFDDLDKAMATGYGFAEIVSQRSAPGGFNPDRAGPDPFDSLSPEEQVEFELAFRGTEQDRYTYVEPDGGTSVWVSGGCVGRAYKDVWGHVGDYAQVGETRTYVSGELWSETLSDGNLQSALSEWRRCMSRSGFEYENPEEATEDVGQQIGNHPVEEARLFEIEVATQDVMCRQESDLTIAFGAAFATVAHDLLDDWEDELIAIQEIEAEAVGRARQALADTS